MFAETKQTRVPVRGCGPVGSQGSRAVPRQTRGGACHPLEGVERGNRYASCRLDVPAPTDKAFTLAVPDFFHDLLPCELKFLDPSVILRPTTADAPWLVLIVDVVGSDLLFKFVCCNVSKFQDSAQRER